MEPGQTLFLLTYLGEGVFKAWFNEKLYDGLDASIFYNGACDVDPSRCTGTILEMPQREWWVQIKNANGQIGWTMEAQKFDGRDRFAAR